MSVFHQKRKKRNWPVTSFFVVDCKRMQCFSTVNLGFTIMKIKPVCLVVVLGMISTASQAQSSVTLYGVLDTYLQSYKTNVGPTTASPLTPIQSITLTKIDGGGMSGNRWGMRVSEDLGGGLSAIANLESGFAMDTGASNQGGRLFGRRATVGLTGGFGTVTVGRNASPYTDVVYNTSINGTVFDPAYGNTGAPVSPIQAGALQGNSVNSLAFMRQGGFTGATWIGAGIWFDNSIKYISPNFSGFSGAFMYAAGEDKTTSVAASKSVSANLQYANGPLRLIGGYQSEGFARTATTKPALENTFATVVYDFGVAKASFGANRAKYKDVLAPAGLGGGNFAAQKEYSIAVDVPVGAAVLSAAYGRGKGDTLGSSTGFGLQATYALSKRTNLYAGAVSTKTFDRLTSAISAGPVGSNNALGLPGGVSSPGRLEIYGVGIRHRF